MNPRLANSLLVLRNQLNTLYPHRNKASDGWIGDSAHSSTVSQHNPNILGVVTAIDITHDPINGMNGLELANQLIKDHRTWYVIFNRRIWENGAWKTYSGVNPHDKHVHISVKQGTVQYDNKAAWEVGDIMKPTQQQIKEVFMKFLNKQPTGEDLAYYEARDIRDLYYQVLYYGIIPKKAEVEEAFKNLQPWQSINTAPYTDQTGFYTSKPHGFLYRDLAYGLKKKMDSENTAIELKSGIYKVI